MKTFSTLFFIIFVQVFCILQVKAAPDGLMQELESITALSKSITSETNIRTKSGRVKLLVQKIKWSGIDDTQFFDILHQELQKYLDNPVKDDKFINEYLSWLAQGLAISGKEKYRESIITLTTDRFHKKVVRHATNSLSMLSQFKNWNPLINKNLTGIPLLDLPRHRTINMLNSGVPELTRVGTKLVTKNYLADEEILDLVEVQLLEAHNKTGGDKEKVAAVAWMCKALGQSYNSKYLPTLEKVLSESKQKSVKRWANKSISMLKK